MFVPGTSVTPAYPGNRTARSYFGVDLENGRVLGMVQSFQMSLVFLLFAPFLGLSSVSTASAEYEIVST